MSEHVVVEKRDAEGNIVPGPGNRRSVSKDALFEEFFAANPLDVSATWSEVEDWLKADGWHVRPRTW